MTEHSTGLRPLILVRGFGGFDVSDEQANGYQGFNEGTVYPGERGDNYIYEGFVLRAMKTSLYSYRDATNVVGYYAEDMDAPPDPLDYPDDLITGSVVLDPSVARRVIGQDISGTMWIYRYYDLRPRAVRRYGEGLARLIDILARLSNTEFTGVDIVAHSMGGLVVREALRYMAMNERNPNELVHRIVTLGTPHRGIAFQVLPRWLVAKVPRMKRAADELAAFDPEQTKFLAIKSWFDPRRILTVVGTDYRSYSVKVASLGNRISSLFTDGTLSYNRSDGLVKQSSAQLPGSPRTFVHKCHGGQDSLVTSREAYEIAMRFFHGTHRVRLWLDKAEVLRGQDLFSRSEFYLGVSIKPLYVDFELFHQSDKAENCYGPFRRTDLTDTLPALEELLSVALARQPRPATVWAGPDRLVWEGWLDARAKPDADRQDMIFRIDFSVSERDTYGIGFSDNVVFHKQYYVQALQGQDGLELLIHTGERYLGPQGNNAPGQAQAAAEDENVKEVWAASSTETGWTFETVGTGFTGTWRVAIEPDA